MMQRKGIGITQKLVKNHVELANCNYQIVAMQLVNGITKKKAKKIV
jgi:hypothetical protein